MALLNFKYGAQSNLSNQAFSAGTIYITSDTKKLFIDNPHGTSGRICLGDFQLISWTKSDTVTSPTAALTSYSLKDANTLYITVESASGATAMWRYNGTTFVAISNSEEIAGIVADIAAINTALNGKAPTNHASSSTTYGAASTSQYGHVKLSNATDSTSTSLGATANAVKLAYDRGSLGVTNAATAQAAAEAADAKAVAAQAAADAAATAAEKADTNADGRVSKTGDTMTGLLTLSGAPTANLHAATKAYVDSAKSSAISTAAGDATAKANAVLGTSSDSASANTVYGAKAAASAAATTANNAMPKTGGTFSGNVAMGSGKTLTVNTPSADGHAATKAYVDSAASAAKTGAEATAQGYVDALKGASTDGADAVTVYGAIAKAGAAATAASNAAATANAALPKAGGTMTGFITLHAAPTNNMHAANKQYVDNAKSSAISTVQGTSSDTKDSATVAGAKKYTDSAISTVNTTINTLKSDIGNLSNIMNFLGTTTTTLSNGSTTASITVDSKSVTAVKGDVVISGDKEFVFDGTKWAEIGDVSAQSTAITNLQNTVGTKPNSPTMDNTLWEEVADLRSDLGESGAAAGAGSAFARIKALETWKSTHATEYTNLEERVDALETTVGDHSTAIGATGDAASTTGSIYARIKSLQNNLGSSSAAAGTSTAFARIKSLETNLGASNATAGADTAFARIKTLEDWKGTHTTAYNTLSNSVSSNTTAINNLTTVLTWGTF